MYIECTKNSGKPYLRIVEWKYTNKNGKVKIKKIVFESLGLLSKYDDGQPDFLKRFREKFKNSELNFCNEFNIEIKNKLFTLCNWKTRDITASTVTQV